MNESGTYRVEIEDGRIALKTTSFKAERGSVLHSGIYNREFSSILVGAAAAASVLVLFALKYELQPVHYVVAAAVFVAAFPLARVYLFKEPCLETVIDRSAKTVSVTLRRPFGRRSVTRPLSSLSDIGVVHTRIEPENPDGVAFVKKIALQHGTVIPGFGQTEDFYSVVLRLAGEEFTVLTTRAEAEANAVAEKLKRYVGG
ncbi:MAG TPA: hypothetical protein ENJ04_09845 [Nitrospirae bacterium]|nr:hypothetical protein [Nitrospirota bacterium]